MSKYIIEKVIMQDEISEEGEALIRNHLFKKLRVRFVSPQETLENNDKKVEDFSEGDILEGNIIIEGVMNPQKNE